MQNKKIRKLMRSEARWIEQDFEQLGHALKLENYICLTKNIDCEKSMSFNF